MIGKPAAFKAAVAVVYVAAIAGCAPTRSIPSVVHPDATWAATDRSGLGVEQAAVAVNDEHGRALERQLTESWQRRPDKDEQLLVPLADANHWKRVRFWLVDHFVGFRYGEDFDALNVVFIHDVEPGTKLTTEYCMKNAERWARPQLRSYDVHMGPIQTRHATWKHDEIEVRTADAVVDYGVGPTQFSAAWAAYPAYSDACLVFAFAVPWGEHRELATQVRDRWVEEGVRRLKPLTEGRPHRVEE